MITREQAKRCVGLGWHELIDEFYDEFPDVHMVQVKEKFGMLCLYHDMGTDASMDKEVDIMNRSQKMCEECGKPCEQRDIRNWVWTLCDEHAKPKIDLTINDKGVK